MVLRFTLFSKIIFFLTYADRNTFHYFQVCPTQASSLNIGCAVDGITRGIVSANIGELELNSLIFQDNIAKMNRTLEDARKGARDVGRMLESKQLKANTSKSKFVVIGTPESRTEILKEAEANPIKMGDSFFLFLFIFLLSGMQHFATVGGPRPPHQQ